MQRTAAAKIAKIHLVTAVWGTWHVEAFLTVALPSLLAPGNLPKLMECIDGHYFIFTHAQYAACISEAPSFRALQELIDARVFLLDDKWFRGHTLEDSVANHHRLWHKAIEDAARVGAMAMLITPDVCWADGSLGHVVSLLKQGKRVIYSKAVRVTDETFTPALIERYRDDNKGTIRIQRRELVALAIDHSHPLWAMNVIGCSHTPVHCELLIRPVSGEGYLMTLLITDGFVIDASVPSLIGLSVSAQPTPPDQIAVCTDSDEMMAVSLTPLTKDPDWYYYGCAFDAFRFSTFWAVNDIPDSTAIYSAPFSYRATEPAPQRWGELRRRSDRFMHRVRGGFHTVGITHAIDARLSCHRSSVIAASMYHSRSLQRQLALDEPLTILTPVDEAYSELPSWFWEQVFSGGKHLEFLELLVADYVIRGPVGLNRQELNGGKTFVIEACAVSGRILRFRSEREKLSVDGIPISASWKMMSGHMLYRIDRLLSAVDIPVASQSD